MPRKTPHPPLDLGPLLVDAINAVLGTELEPGHVRLSATAHRHMAEDHLDDYLVCIEHLRDAIAKPTFVGQAPHHPENFELVRRVKGNDGRAVLVAFGLAPDKAGEYRVKSCYLVKPKVVDGRRQAGRLRPPPR